MLLPSNADDQQVAANDNPPQETPYSNSAASSCSFSAINDEGTPPVLTVEWGFGFGAEKGEVATQSEMNKNPVDARYQVTGPKGQGVWVLAENWKEYVEPIDEFGGGQ